MNSKNVLSITFHGSTKLHYRALKATGWCDAFYLDPNELVGGITGSIDELKKLGINYNKYSAALIYHDGLGPAQKYFVEECIKHKITIYANQHGFNKSIYQIIEGTPKIYSKYWNCTGKYFLDRYKEVTGVNPIKQRWISIGSLVHDYLYKNYHWNKDKNNGKVLIIHEPDLQDCEGDPYPHDSETITAFVISELHKTGIPADFKPHPNWSNFVGNQGKPLKKPQGISFVNINVENIVEYALVIGSRSSMLLEAAVMGVPTLALESKSSWKDDKYPPVEAGENGLIPTYSKKNFQKGLIKHFGKAHEYDFRKLCYYCGHLGNVQQNYIKFIKEDLKQPDKFLGKTIYDQWKKNISEYRPKNDSLRYKCKYFLWFIYIKSSKIYSRTVLQIKRHTNILKIPVLKNIKKETWNSISFQKMFWVNAVKKYNNKDKIFGYDWGDPQEDKTKDCDGQILGNYLFILKKYLLPNIKNAVVLEIGSGGGKWTQFMKSAKQIICVDLSMEILGLIKNKLNWKNLKYYETLGDELNGINDNSVDFIFSMDTLVRTSYEVLHKYFSEIKRVLKQNGKICLHLPCKEVYGSRKRGFTSISAKDIIKLCRSYNLEITVFDKENISHGIILLANKNVRN